MNKTQDQSNGISHSASQIQKAVQNKGVSALDEAEEFAESATSTMRSALETGRNNVEKAMSPAPQKQSREPSRQQSPRQPQRQPDLSESEPEAELEADSDQEQDQEPELEAQSYSESDSDLESDTDSESESNGSGNRLVLAGVTMLRSYMSLVQRNNTRFYMAFDAYLNMLTTPIFWPEGLRLNEGREGGQSDQGQRQGQSQSQRKNQGQSQGQKQPQGQGRRMDPMRNKAQTRQSM